MSIINKMHQDFQQVQQEQPILAQMPEKKGGKKAFLFLFIILLLGSSLGLSYLIFTQESKTPEAEIALEKAAVSTSPKLVDNKPETPVKPQKQEIAVVKSVVKQKPVVQEKLTVKVEPKATVKVVKSEESKVEKPEQVQTSNQAEENKRVSLISEPVVDKQVATTAVQQPTLETKKESVLEIKPVQLSKAELAQIHLREAQRAEDKGDLELAASKRKQALTLAPTLNEVRKSLALFYYGLGDTEQAKGLLQAGAIVSPDYSDFNLMLSRIAVKAGDYQRAYLYLEQHPPEVKGHLDYYVSHAILAQKFKKYKQSEGLYSSLLSQRPNNGRWRMALAIAQDKQGKGELAVRNYQNALLQTDLSLKAKAYIKQRLTYLEKTL